MSTQRMMQATLVALMPGLIVMIWQFGPGVAFNVTTAVLAALLTEALMLRLRHRPLSALMDGSALLTGVLLGLSLPPLLPFWMILFATGVALTLGKHIYGGLGHNLFNPAMVGFAVLILSFPLAMSQWLPPTSIEQATTAPSALTVLRAKWHTSNNRADYDGITRATPLDARRQGQDALFADGEETNSQAWHYINLAFFLGGGLLLYLGVIPWQTPLSLLLALGGLSLVFPDAGSTLSLHLLSGATMLAAFFIVTDPVTCPALPAGLFIFGAGVGIITFIIRTTGAYPEGIAFAVLLMNACTPLIDLVLGPRRKTT